MIGGLLATLHVVSMFAAVTLLVGQAVLLETVVARSGTSGFSRLQRATRPVEILGILLLVAGVLLGFATALTTGIPLDASWLLIAYVIVVALMVLGPVQAAAFRRLARSSAEAGDAPIADEGVGRRRLLTVVIVALYLAVIADMVLKPAF